MAVRLGLSLTLALTLVADAFGQSSPIYTTAPALSASLERIARGSALWRQAVDTIRDRGGRVIVATPDQVTFVAADGAPTEPFDAALLAEAVPIVRDGTRVDVVMVVVNLSLLEARYRERPFLPIELERDLDRILVHEIYGHAMPYLMAGDVSGRCADPQPRERASDACSIRRENAVRAELGLGRRHDEGLEGLSLSRNRLRR